MNDIYNFNNQYLKCIVTKYKSTIDGSNKFMANSGALIIYHPDNEQSTYNDKEYSRNYIYLGGEFLASGYGFLCEDMRNDAEKIVKNYDDTINAIYDKINEEAAQRKQGDENIINDLQNYVKINGGFIDNTNLNINGKVIKTRDIILYGEEAKYTNLEVKNVSLKIVSDNGNEYFIMKDNKIYVPLGILIKYVEISIEYDIHDSGGIDYLEVYHKYLTSSVNLNSVNQNDIETVVIKYDQDNNGNAKEGIIKYKKIFGTNEQLYVTNVINDFIEGFKIYVKETPVEKYKSYPRIKKYLDIDIKSTGNIITKNYIELLKNISIVPLYNIHYTFGNDTSKDNISIPLDTLENKPDKVQLLTNINNEIQINITNIDKTRTSLCIAIPSIYKLTKLYAINDENERFDWTGSIFVSKSNNIITYKNSTGSSYATYYDLYEVINTKSFSKCNKIIINVALIENEVTYNDINVITNNRLTPPMVFGNTINDEDFNNLYWVSFNNDNTLYNVITNTLDQLNENCVPNEQ